MPPVAAPERGSASTLWPALPLAPWRETYDTLHMWTQIVGKICLALTPLTNHFWNIAFHVTSRGLAAPSMTAGGVIINVTFDFIDHQLIIQASDGRTERIALQPQPVAEFHRKVIDAFRRLGVETRIWTMPVEVPDPVRFEGDTQHHSYDAAAANAFWRVLLSIKPTFDQFRGGFVGKCSPVHFFWGSFDLAVTRFSGERAPERPGADSITKEAYSHCVVSHGFWPGSGAVPEPAFYAYAAPEPDGFKSARVTPAAAFYSTDLSEFILPYEAVRTAPSPERDLMAFLQSAYDAAATLAGWNRLALERT
jgi:hypothetical protein